MAATPVYGTVSFQGLSGAQIVEPFTVTDVANAYCTFDSSGLTFVNLPEPATLVDIVLSADGTDTKKLRIWVNNKDTGITYRDASVIVSVNNRIPLPIKLGNPTSRQGVQFQFKQLA